MAYKSEVAKLKKAEHPLTQAKSIFPSTGTSAQSSH